MNTALIERRRRRQHSAEFKAESVPARRQPGRAFRVDGVRIQHQPKTTGIVAPKLLVTAPPPAPSRSESVDPDVLYGQLAQEYGPALARIARAHEADTDLSRDHLQELHVVLWRSLGGYDRRCSLRTWVYRVAHNTAVTCVTRRHRSWHGVLCTLDEMEARGLATDPDSCASGADYDLDGRGNLSEEALAEFTRFFLSTCLDQVRFMEGLMQPDSLRTRILLWAKEEIRLNRLPQNSGAILEALLYRGDAAGIVGTGDRQARRVVSALIERGVVISVSSRAPLRLAFPAALASRWMPGLFPDQCG